MHQQWRGRRCLSKPRQWQCYQFAVTSQVAEQWDKVIQALLGGLEECVFQSSARWNTGKNSARKKSGYYFNYVMSQKANFSRNKWDRPLKPQRVGGNSRYYKNPLFLRPFLKQSSMLRPVHDKKGSGCCLDFCLMQHLLTVHLFISAVWRKVRKGSRKFITWTSLSNLDTWIKLSLVSMGQ